MFQFLTMFSWFTLPRMTDVSYDGGLSTTTGILTLADDYTGTFFSSLSLIVISVAVGIPIAIIAIKWLIKLVRGNTGSLFKRRRR